ncbi:Vps54-like protein-domain-containing protein [Mycena rosella]|uniref:Vps54-like protein-domain-containing protein n=1 Tax=Mycena rosella TaxID=1033263 RepID=A0AAD7H0N0_MYCRO|nr:Vps54-like protein-domain-containing protein [Mycena rosella]
MSDHSSSNLSRPASPVSPLPPTARPYRFNWDPAQRGPESVSGTTEGRDYFAGPSRLNLLNTSSATLALGALPSQWSSSTHGFHAISTVLNNPHKRQAPPKAHSSLPAVAPADLPRVRRKDFDSYLRAITPEWERLEHSNQLNRDAEMQLEGTSTPRASSSSGPFAQTPDRPLPPLDVVPTVFFKPGFNLGDPRTFNAVTEQDSPDHDPAADPTALSYSLPLLEKFSHYADTVEQHLVREISLRSASFFAALSNLHELQSESEECLDRISKLRTLLKDVDENGAKKGLEVVRKGSRMRNLGKVREGVKFVGGVVEMTGVAKGLVAAGQWDRALGVVEDMERMWDGPPATEASTPTPPMTRSSSQPKLHGSINGNANGRLSSLPPTPEERPPPSPALPPPIIPLSSLNAFSALPTHLRTLTMEITSSLSAELVSVLRVDLLERISADAPAGPDSKIRILKDLKDRLRPLLQGLVRTKGVREATLSWREVVLDEVRGVIRRLIPAYDIIDEGSGSTASSTNGGGDTPRPGLANHLRNMPHAEFLQLIQTIYKSFLNAVEGLHAQGTAFLEVLETTNSTSPPNIAALQDELSDVLSSAAELSNTQAAKLIIIRAEQHAVLSLTDFFAFFNDSWSFVVKCEVICRKMIVGLRGVVISQSKTFLQTFHQARLTQSGSLVENEQWEQTDATPAIQHIADVFVDCAVRDVPELLVVSGAAPGIPVSSPSEASLPYLSSSISLTPASSTNSMNGVPPSPSAPSVRRTNGTSSQTKNAKTRLRIEERTFSTVVATSEALALLLDYLRVIMNLSMLTTDTMSRVIEFLKAFNSRTCQVVLGAGAMKSAGLKNITAKHLALASQSLSIIITLIPYVRETFRRHLSQKQAVMLVEFDKLKRDYQEHQNEIHAKLIAIMGDRLTAHIRTFQAIDWTVPREGVNAYMSVLVRETVTLHKVLSRHLSVTVVEDVMAQVFAAINHRLSEEYAKLVLPSEDARKGLLVDARFLHQKLSELKNVGAPSGMLEIVIAELRVPRPVSPSPSTTNFNANANANPSANPRLLANRLRWNSLAPAANGNASTNPTPSVNGSGPNTMSASPVTSPASSANGTNSPPPPPPLLTAPDTMAAAGFRQVDPGSPRPESPRPESPLPALPPEAMAETGSVATPNGVEVFDDPLGASTPTRAVHSTPTPGTPRTSTPVPAPTPSASAPASSPLPATPAPEPVPPVTAPAPTDAVPAADGAPTPVPEAAEPHPHIQDDSTPNAADNGIARPDRDPPSDLPPPATV